MPRDKTKDLKYGCPVGDFFSNLEKAFGKDSDFLKHMRQSRIEFLKAVRSFVDHRIADLEKKKSSTAKKKMDKIEVE